MAITIGNFTTDADGQQITWTAFGKVHQITGPTLKDATGPIASITFGYDASGNRTMKQVVYTNQPAKDYTEWYVRDAGGNTMATYRETYNPQGTNAMAHTTQREVYLYGSDRLGVYTVPTATAELSWAPETALPTSGSLAVGHKAYELKDHLGNVRAVVGDQGSLLNTAEYYPFGMAMAVASQGNGNYRYGFNGKEKDDELKGAGNSLDFGARIYDARIGRWLSLDPLQEKYPWISPFNFVANSPLRFIDTDGREIEGVKFNKATGQFEFSEAAVARGTDKYVQARIQTESGMAGVLKLVEDSRKFKVTVTDKLLVMQAEDGTYGLAAGGADPSNLTLIISTNRTEFACITDENLANDLMTFGEDGELVPIALSKDQLKDQLSTDGNDPVETDYQKAYKDSGLQAFDANDENRAVTDEQYIHGTGAHEEIHLSKSNIKAKGQYNTELPAMQNELKERKEYIEKKSQ